MQIRPRAVQTAVAVAGLLLASCGAEDVTERVVEEVAERAGDGDVDIDSDDGSVSIETDEGSFNIGSQELPEELPDELPVPDGLSVNGSVVQNVDGVQTIGLQATSDASFDELAEFFEAELASSGWTITSDSATDGAGLRVRSFQIEGFGFTGLVGITAAGEDGDEDSVLAVSINLQQDEASA